MTERTSQSRRSRSPDGLLDRLVEDLRPVRRRSPLIDAALLCGLCLAELALFLAIGMQRDDMPKAMGAPSFWWKLSSLGLLAVIGGATSILSFDPARSPRRGLRWMAIAILACLFTGWIIDAASGEGAPLLQRLDWHQGISCATKMALLSLPPVAALGLLMRRGAPTEPVATSLAVGLTAASWGAFVFVFACPKDDPLYLAVWYMIGCGAVALSTRLLMPLINRW